MRLFLRVRERLSSAVSAHLAALAYMSDGCSAGSAPRAHKLRGFAAPRRNADGSEWMQREIGMLVSIDHTIFFHRPMVVRTDEWVLSERQTPWSGGGKAAMLCRLCGIV